MSSNYVGDHEVDNDMNIDNSVETTSHDSEEPDQWKGPQKEETSDNLEDGEDLHQTQTNAASSTRLSRLMTGGTSLAEKAKHSKEPLPAMGGGLDYPPNPGDINRYFVAYDGPNDPLHPQNWPLLKKLIATGILGFTALALTLGSAMFSMTSPVIMEKFHVGEVVATLGTSLFVFGFASGPLLWGPLSELYGRKIILIPSCFLYCCFCFATATAENLQTIMICRFFGGFLGGAPLVVAPAAMADMFSAKGRPLAINSFAMVVFGGPMLAPIFSAFTVKNSALGWRWTQYFTGIVSAFALVLAVTVYEESHQGIILAKKAEELRRRTDNWAIRAPVEEVSLSIKEIVENNLTRPLYMLSTEPILFLITLYNAFIYGLLYLFLTAIPLIFEGEYHFVSGVAELPYLSMLTGILIGAAISLLLGKRYSKIVEKNDNKPIPEEQLPPMMIGSILFSGGLFWLGWAGSFPERVPWIVPTIGAAFIGAGLFLIFLPCLTYIIDCYLVFAASALAANTFLRSIFGGVFPLFARQMFVNMKIKWAATLLGCFAAILIPVPFLFYKFGRSLRSKSKFAFVL